MFQKSQPMTSLADMSNVQIMWRMAFLISVTAILTAFVVGSHMEKKLTVEFSADKIKLMEKMQHDCGNLVRYNLDLVTSQCTDHIKQVHDQVNKRMSAAMIMLSPSNQDLHGGSGKAATGELGELGDK